MSDQQPYVSIRGLSFSRGDRLIYDNLDVDFPKGKITAIMGPSGTGKTTLTRTMLQRIPAHVRVAYVLNSKLDESDLLASICSELSIKIPTRKNVSFSKAVSYTHLTLPTICSV